MSIGCGDLVPVAPSPKPLWDRYNLITKKLIVPSWAARSSVCAPASGKWTRRDRRGRRPWPTSQRAACYARRRSTALGSCAPPEKKSPPFSENVLKKRCEIDFPESQTSSDRTSQVIMPVKNDSMLIGYEVFFDYWHGEVSQLESVWNGVENESHLSQWTIAVGFVSDEDAWHPWRQPVVVALLQPARQRLRKSGETRKKIRKNIGIILRSW